MKSQEKPSFVINEFLKTNKLPYLRGIEPHWEENTLLMKFYFSQELSEFLIEEASVFATEVLAQYEDGLLNEDYRFLPMSVHLPESQYRVYLNSSFP